MLQNSQGNSENFVSSNEVSSSSSTQNNADIHENIMCTLCEDFLVDAVTLTECLHFFCHSCLLRHLKSDNRCPKCLQDLGKNLSNAYRSDMVLQNLVFKLVPNFFWKQLKKQLRKHRKALNSHKMLQTSKTLQRRQNSTRNYFKVISKICSESEKISVVLNYVPMNEIQGANQKPCTSEYQIKSKKVEDNDINNITTCVFKRYFRCPAKATLAHLKKLMEIKLAMSEPYTVYFIDNSFVNLLDEELSLQDLVYMYSWNRKAPLNISFTIVRLNSDEDCPPVLDIEIMPQLRPETPNRPMDKMDSHSASTEIGNKISGILKVEEQSPPTLQIPQLHVSLPPSAFDSNGVCAIQPHSIIKTTSTTIPPSHLKSEKSSMDSKKVAQPQRKRRKNAAPLKAQEPQNNIKKSSENLTPDVPNLLEPTKTTSTTSVSLNVAENSDNSYNPNTILSEYLSMPQQRYQEQQQIQQEKQQQNSQQQYVTVAQQLQQQRSTQQQQSKSSETNLKEKSISNIKNYSAASKPSISALKAKLDGKSPEMLVPPVSASLMPSFGTNPASSLYALFQQQQNNNAAAQQLLQASGNCGNFNNIPYAFLNPFLNPQFAAAASQQFAMNNANFLSNTNSQNICQTSSMLNGNLIKKSPTKKAKISDGQKSHSKKAMLNKQNNSELTKNIPPENSSNNNLLEKSNSNSQATTTDTKTTKSRLNLKPSSFPNVISSSSNSVISPPSNKVMNTTTPISPMPTLSLMQQTHSPKNIAKTKCEITTNNNSNSFDRLAGDIPSLFYSQKKSICQTASSASKPSKLNPMIDAAVATNRASATNSLTSTKPTLAS